MPSERLALPPARQAKYAVRRAKGKNAVAEPKIATVDELWGGVDDEQWNDIELGLS